MTKRKPPEEKEKVGKPLMYNTPELLEEAINKYFLYCEGEKALDDDGNPIITPKGQYLYIRDPKPRTVEGLCVFLGFKSKQSWYDYAEKPEYLDVITRARLMLEQYNAESLYDRDRFKGAERTLVHHYDWEPANQIQINNNTLNIDMTEDEIVKRLAKSGYFQLSGAKMEIEEK